MDSGSAKHFLISRVVQEAESEHVSLSGVEMKMLHFSESHPSIPNIYEVNAEFERNYDNDEYEKKVAGLLKSARDHDRDESATQEQKWKDALDALKEEDHYILVMVQQAFGRKSSDSKHRLRDWLIYIAVGIAVVAAAIWSAMRR